MSSNFSVSTRSYVFVSGLLRFLLLSGYSPYCELLSAGKSFSRNLRRNFRLHFTAEPYFTYVSYSYRSTRCSEVYCTMTVTYCNWEQRLMELITAAYCWQIINSHAWTTQLTVKHNAVKRFTSYFTSFRTLSPIRHVDSSAKLVYASQQAVRWSPRSAEPWTGQKRKPTNEAYI
jgi:hypothetical protein